MFAVVNLLANESRNVVVLLGGKSSEREVSLRSGNQVRAALERLGHSVVCVDPTEAGLVPLAEIDPDVVFIALHGSYGEDGCVQGALELMHMAYTGSGVLASALAMDKAMSKLVFAASDIPTPPHITVRRTDGVEVCAEAVLEKVGVPCVVKPSREGSSVGISFVYAQRDIGPALELAFEHGSEAVIEKFITGTEVTVGVLDLDEPVALPTLEIVVKNEHYDYDAKYTAGKSEHIIPARIGPEAEELCRRLGVSAHTALGCQGYSRTDMIVDTDGNVWVLEVNTLPGLTDLSLLPDAAKAAGISFDQLISIILNSAHKR